MCEKCERMKTYLSEMDDLDFIKLCTLVRNESVVRMERLKEINEERESESEPEPTVLNVTYH